MFYDTMSILAYAAGLVLIFIVSWIFIKPVARLFKLLLSGIFGGLVLAAVNFFGDFIGFSVVISPLSSLLAGLLGLPGVVLVIILQYIL